MPVREREGFVTCERLLGEALADNGESFEDVEARSMSGREWRTALDPTNPSVVSADLYAWTADWVYFQSFEDGELTFSYVPRNPDVVKEEDR